MEIPKDIPDFDSKEGFKAADGLKNLQQFKEIIKSIPEVMKGLQQVVVSTQDLTGEVKILIDLMTKNESNKNKDKDIPDGT